MIRRDHKALFSPHRTFHFITIEWTAFRLTESRHAVINYELTSSASAPGPLRAFQAGKLDTRPQTLKVENRVCCKKLKGPSCHSFNRWWYFINHDFNAGWPWCAEIEQPLQKRKPRRFWVRRDKDYKDDEWFAGTGKHARGGRDINFPTYQRPEEQQDLRETFGNYSVKLTL